VAEHKRTRTRHELWWIAKRVFLPWLGVKVALLIFPPVPFFEPRLRRAAQVDNFVMNNVSVPEGRRRQLISECAPRQQFRVLTHLGFSQAHRIRASSSRFGRRPPKFLDPCSKGVQQISLKILVTVEYGIASRSKISNNPSRMAFAVRPSLWRGRTRSFWLIFRTQLLNAHKDVMTQRNHSSASN
jgi:hypothetical protein